MKVEVSNAEIIDKYTIVEIKIENFRQQGKFDKVLRLYREQSHLNNAVFKMRKSLHLDSIKEFEKLGEDLYKVNSKLWKVEDEIRALDKDVFPLDKHDIKKTIPDAVEKYVNLARKVYHLNDKRSKIKSKLNKVTDSYITEEKSYNEL